MTKKKRTSLTVRKDVMEEAQRRGLNISETAEAGIMAAIKTAHEKLRPQENKALIDPPREHSQRERPAAPFGLCSMCRYRRCCARNRGCG